MKKIFAAAALLAAMAMAAPVIASDAPGYGVVIGGRVQYEIGWQVKSDDPQIGNATDDTLINFFTGLRSSSFLNATFSSSDKTTGAKIEIGIAANSNLNNDGGAPTASTSLRLAYGWWKVGNCTLLAGQAWTRLGGGAEVGALLGGNKSGKTDLLGFGFVGMARVPRLALAMTVNDFFGFDISIAQAGSEAGAYESAIASRPYSNYTTGSTENYLPRLEVVLDFTFGNFKISPGAGISYQQWKYEDTAVAPNDLDDSVLSYLLFLPIKYQDGPFWAVLSAFYSQNRDTDWTGENGYGYNVVDANGKISSPIAGNFGNFGGQPWAVPALGANGSIEDTTSWGLGLGFGYAFTDQLTVKVAGGFEQLSNDAWGDGVNGNDSYTRWGAFIAAPYKLTGNLTIQPEIAYYNYGDAVGYGANFEDDDAGSEWLLGVTFQFLF